MFNLYEGFPTALTELPINDITTNPDQPRKRFREKDLILLSESIKQIGIINPVSVRYTEGRYELIAGERRLRAAKLAGRYSIPCMLVSADNDTAAIMALTENLQRADLNCFEQAQGMYAILENTRLTQQQLAEKLCISQSAVANKLRLLRIPPGVRRLLIQYNMKERHARALLCLEDEEQMIKAVNTAANRKMNADNFENYVRKLKTEANKPKKTLFRGFCRDLRLYINSLNHTVNVMKENGINTVMEKTENEDSIIYKIVINK